MRKTKIKISAFTSSLFFLVTFGVKKGEFFKEFDHQLMLKAAALRTDALNGPIVDVTALGSRTLIISFYLITIALFYALKLPRAALQLVAAGIGAAVLSPVMKGFIERERPTEVTALVKVSTHSYPSGHTLGATVFYFTIALLLSSIFSSNVAKVSSFLVCFMIILAVGLSRIYLGVHYPSDVLGGTLLGISWALVVSLIFGFGWAA